ncbi:PDZ and LIM domain protein Zasp-like isoform X8 [Leptotrombidium deliense]|uniref:PDZ and LIM domain protein Zasp-like isoform X8 n=1 Tax=Leptotrombidium deliense TaxID=299467 RepID=A0A443S9A5_9ACAR|nr:PDZ and LIM domain protein Zasp-like isoform X8 [Leptotrombidium deliense]
MPDLRKGGTVTWKPSVTPIGSLPRPGKHDMNVICGYGWQRLMSFKKESHSIGSGHNVAPKPFGGPGGPALVHKQFNSPLNLYSMKNIQEAIQAHTEVLAPGVKGINFSRRINFMKPDAPVNKESAVYRAIIEEEQTQKGDYSCSSQESGRNLVSPTTQSHAFHRVQQDRKSMVGNSSPSVSPRIGTTGTPFSKVSDNTTPQTDAANTCAECGRLIVGVFCRINEKNLHAECFKCATCGTSLKNTGYFNVHGKLYCDVHAQQAAKLMTSSESMFEPITIRPVFSGAAIPNNVGIVGSGLSSPLAKAPIIGGAPKITIPSQPTTLQSSGKLSPSVVSAMPWHSPAGVHHVTAPHSPGRISSVAPPVAPKPKFRPVSGPAGFYPSNQPYNGPSVDSHRPISGTAKFTWPPPQTRTCEELAHDGSDEQKIVSSLSRPLQGVAHASDTNKVTQEARTSQTFYSQTSMSQTTGHSTPAPGQSSIPGSRPAPRRGRGQLKPQAPAGTRVPICSVCGSPIRGPFIVALGKTWCPEHFTCANSKCKRNLEDFGFVEEQGQLYCESCFEAYLAPICAKCNVRIKGDCLMALERQWHPECFSCAYCKKPFGNSSFYLEDGSPYCEKDWNDLFTTKCVGCNFPIEAGDRWVEALNNNYHSQCFKCTVCHKNLEGQSFYAKAGRPYCKSHAR